ncbi:MAG TPA: gas vesicle synthesis GvpLGvpF [Lentisphaeria bacterium]|nr:MAG: hypothetical protein A2X47_05385 [Lentisphaerae bacterium GWF2_38_69]HBM16049.1 gas vesicle synthesis GvpLGvpF [Lentisphaeria bacterium]
MDSKEGVYIYCIIESKEELTFKSPGIGERGDHVYTVVQDDIAAVVSKSPIITYRIQRVHLMCHEKVIEEVMGKTTVLPVKFGTITETEESLKLILKREYPKLKDLLLKMQGKKEVGLKAVFKDESIFAHILGKYSEIAKFKEIIASKPPEKTHFQRAKIGEMVEKALESEKSFFENLLIKELSPLAIETVTNKTYGDKMILNAAFLIHNKDEEKIEKAINAFDALYSNLVKLKYVCFIPPFNFVNLTIHI